MSLFEELNIKTKSIDGEIWVSLKDISGHTLNATIEFLNEFSAAAMTRSLSPMEQIYSRGLAEGMLSVATLLAQGGVEAEIHENINTVEDLLKTLDKKRFKE